MYPETYHHHRHGGYGFNVLFWVDHHGTIIRLMCNYPASASDQTIYDASSFARLPRKFLKKHEEFIFTDLGFKREIFSVPPYKGQEAKVEHNALFNHAQRCGRVKVCARARAPTHTFISSNHSPGGACQRCHQGALGFIEEDAN